MKQIHDDKKKMKRILGFLILVLGFSLISAGYVFGIFTNITGSVVGGSTNELTISLNLEDFLINTTDSSQEFNQPLIVHNENGLTNMSLVFEVNKTLLDANCSNHETDCEVNFFIGSTPLTNNEIIELPSGESTFWLNSSCIKRSCLQEIEVNIELTEEI